MDEIELMQRFRDELPAAREERRASARLALLARIEAGEDAPRPRASTWRSRRTRLALAGVGLAAVAIALPLALVGGGGRVEPAAAQALRKAAAVAAVQEPVVPGPDQFLYTRSKGAYLHASSRWSALVPSVHESWVSLDGSRRGRVREVSGKPRFVSAAQRAGWEAAGSPPLPKAGRVEDVGLSGGRAEIDPADLSTDPQTLRQLIEDREIPGVSGPPGEAETFVLIGDMLRATYLPSAVRAALYEVAAELPGVELLGEVEDPVGRAGTGVAFVDRRRGTRQELIFDPETSALLGERVTTVAPRAMDVQAPSGTLIGYSAYLESKVVDSVGEDPPAGAGGPDNSVGCYETASLDASAAIIHDPDPIAVCARLWREGAIGLRLERLEREGKIPPRPNPRSPELVACRHEDEAPALVVPGSGPEVCSRLGLVPFADG